MRYRLPPQVQKRVAAKQQSYSNRLLRPQASSNCGTAPLPDHRIGRPVFGGAAMQRFRGTSIASSVIASSLVVAVMTTSGSSADLPVVKAPILKAPAALWSWSGLYIGGHVGASLSLTDIADPLGAPIYGDNVRSPGFIGGGQIGFNWQLGSVVLGVEADVSGVSSDGTNTCFAVSGNSVSSN